MSFEPPPPEASSPPGRTSAAAAGTRTSGPTAAAAATSYVSYLGSARNKGSDQGACYRPELLIPSTNLYADAAPATVTGISSQHPTE
jgi:hypothetical protein